MSAGFKQTGLSQPFQKPTGNPPADVGAVKNLSEKSSVGHLGGRRAVASSPAEPRCQRGNHFKVTAFRPSHSFSRRQDAALYGQPGGPPPHYQAGSNAFESRYGDDPFIDPAGNRLASRPK